VVEIHLNVILNLPVQLLVQVVVLLQPVVTAAAVLVVVCLDLLTAVTSANLEREDRNTQSVGYALISMRS
jgi:hypothetical protein